MARWNLLAGWIGILVGFVSGAVPGLFFWREEWLGGYSSWRRRMIRLGHISFFGIGFINVLFALTVSQLAVQTKLLATSSLLVIAGAVAMPLICYLAAWKMNFRQLFPIPVTCLVVAVLLLLKEGFLR